MYICVFICIYISRVMQSSISIKGIMRDWDYRRRTRVIMVWMQALDSNTTESRLADFKEIQGLQVSAVVKMIFLGPCYRQ